MELSLEEFSNQPDSIFGTSQISKAVRNLAITDRPIALPIHDFFFARLARCLTSHSYRWTTMAISQVSRSEPGFFSSLDANLPELKVYDKVTNTSTTRGSGPTESVRHTPHRTFSQTTASLRQSLSWNILCLRIPYPKLSQSIDNLGVFGTLHSRHYQFANEVLQMWVMNL